MTNTDTTTATAAPVDGSSPHWRMPSETAPHDRVYMAFPPRGQSFGDAEDARRAWTVVAHATQDFVPVTMVVDPDDRAAAEAMLSADIELLTAPLDDAWMRDIGPTFVIGDGGRRGAVDWTFNGWGRQEWARWGKDREIGLIVAAHAGAEVVDSELVNEGGGIHVDGAGTVLVTDTVQLDRFRNPSWSRDEIEAELRRTLGVDRTIWFPRGLHRDSQRFGTRGHIDIVATLPDEHTVLIHRQRDPRHPDHHLGPVYDEVLAAASARDGQEWKVIELDAPERIRDEEGWTDYSYVNHLVTNGAVIACTFDDPNDALALDRLAEAYPGREIVGVDARNIFAYGGGIHCITQHLPAV
ncbi:MULTISPECIES: agmatine deiminase family protein [unclassified Brevibacterium]|uniref:agmatine deiminase family protein n=1 Tax=unclassified Brevibacterium TaxID=2614124 RepID=UPI0020180748|nr:MULTISPECIES: agmatine deiminase family protein [unclassified Brevibacterium]MCM1011173.1 agmatine deiminase family protein [Brevibacterium sp. XM4083]